MPDPVVTYVGRHDWVDTPSLIGVAIGAPALDRIVVLAAGSRRSATPGRLFTSFTVGGIAAAILAQAGPSNTNITACLASAHVPYGATADILIEANGVYSEGSLDIYTVTGANQNVYDTAQHSVDTGFALVNVEVPSGGCVISCASLTGPPTDPVTWPAALTEGSDVQSSASFRSSSARAGSLAAQQLEITVNNLAEREALVAASWGAGTGGGGPGVNFSTYQTLQKPSQVMTIARPTNFTYNRTLSKPYQSTTMFNSPPRVPRKIPDALAFNALTVPDGTIHGNTTTTNQTKDVVEKLIGVRGDGSKKAVLAEDLASPEFIAQHGQPVGMTVLIPLSQPLPKSWKETTLPSPTAGLRYIQKL